MRPALALATARSTDATGLVCTATRDGEVLGHVVIDSTVGGRAQGGPRLAPDVDAPELRGLAAMTLKHGLLGLPQGGAKAGVLGGTMAFAGIDGATIERFLDARFGDGIAALLAAAERRRVPPREIAEPLARRRFEWVRRAAERPTPAARLFASGLDCYRHGWLPQSAVAPLAPRFFERRVGGFIAEVERCRD